MSPFSVLFFTCLDATKFVLLSVFTPIETICYKICSNSRPKIAKSSLPVDVRRSKTLLFKLPSDSGANAKRASVMSDTSASYKTARLRIVCEQQTHFRRRERSDDRKCVCCSQAILRRTPWKSTPLEERFNELTHRGLIHYGKNSISFGAS